MPEHVSGSGSISMLDGAAQRRAIGQDLDERIARVIEHGQYILGPEVQELEAQLAVRAGVAHAVTCGNGTDALQLVLMAWGIGPGDAVFVPSFTFTATAEVVALLGATPIFCDVRADTFNLDPASLESAISRVRTAGELVPRVVIPVDLFGLPADYPAIHRIAVEQGLWVLGDAAQSFGATLDGRPVGSLAEATATSFFPAKPLGCFGDGGAVFTDDDELASLLRSLRVHGKGTDKYDTVRVGINSRLDTLQAAVLLSKLTVFDAEIAERQRIAERYSDGLHGLAAIATPQRSPSAWAQYTIRLTAEGIVRDEFALRLRERGVPTAVYYPRALHDQPAYRSEAAPVVSCSTATDLAGRVLSLPMQPYLSEADISQVIAAVTDLIA